MLRIGSERLSLETAIASGAEIRQRETVPTGALLEPVGTPMAFHRLHSNHREVERLKPYLKLIDDLYNNSMDSDAGQPHGSCGRLWRTIARGPVRYGVLCKQDGS